MANTSDGGNGAHPDPPIATTNTTALANPSASTQDPSHDNFDSFSFNNAQEIQFPMSSDDLMETTDTLMTDHDTDNPPDLITNNPPAVTRLSTQPNYSNGK